MTSTPHDPNPKRLLIGATIGTLMTIVGASLLVTGHDWRLSLLLIGCGYTLIGSAAVSVKL